MGCVQVLKCCKISKKKTAMNENLDLTKILEGCPKGTEFYSSLFGEVEFVGISDGRIIVDCVRINRRFMFNAAGKYEMSELRYSDDWGNHLHSDECLLFPSKNQRDWSKFERFWDKKSLDKPVVEKFDPKTLHPWDKILVRKIHSPHNISPWSCENFSYIHPNTPQLVNGIASRYEICIPYNDETKHLRGTTDDCPEYYKWWKE